MTEMRNRGSRCATPRPFACLKDALGRINSHRLDRLHELLPFNWKPIAA